MLWFFNHTGAVHAADFNVNVFFDEKDDDCNDGDCSLRDAINLSASGDNIILPAGTYTLNEQITVTKSLTISGNLATDTFIDAQGNGRIFEITAGTVTINNVALINGSDVNGGGLSISGPNTAVALNNIHIMTNTASGHGGGIYVNEGSITLNGGVLSQNSAGVGGAIASGEGSVSSVANITIINTTIMTNTAVAGVPFSQGGGLFINGGAITLTHSAILSNTTDSVGGGAAVISGTASLTNVTVSGNGASNRGGGILNNGGVVTLTNATVANNSSATNGGGISHSAGAGGTVSAGNILIADNSAPTGPDCSGPFNSQDYNLIENISDCIISGDTANNVTGVDPALAPLALNGGNTLSHALDSGSPAIDAGSNAVCPETDQRDNLRPIDGNGDDTATCDIGAYESGIGYFIADYVVNEADVNTLATITVTRSMLTGTTAVDYATVPGTAVAGVDYTTINTTTLTFGSSDRTQTFDVEILGDLLDEDDETFTINLGNPTNGSSVSDSTGLVIIVDNDPLPELTIDDVTITEGDSGSTTASFTVSLSAISSRSISVDYATADGTAVSTSDYDAIPLTQLTFAPGEMNQTVAVTVNGDVLIEGNETFFVNLSNATNATIADSQGEGTITDDDAPPPTLTISDPTVVEGDSGSVTAQFILTLDAPSNETITVDYTTNDGTATAGDDYTAASGTVTFDPNDTSETVSITVLGDTADEADETFTVDLSNAQDVTLAETQGTGTIQDDDPLPTLSITDATVAEGDSNSQTVDLTVTLTGDTNRTVSVNYATANGTASAGSDYTAVSDTLIFTPGGALTQTISVTVIGDEESEPDETFVVNLSGAGNATLTDSQGQITITDDDGYTVFLPFIIKP